MEKNWGDRPSATLNIYLQNVTQIVEGNYIQYNKRDLRVYIGSIDEKSPFFYTSVFGV